MTEIAINLSAMAASRFHQDEEDFDLVNECLWANILNPVSPFRPRKLRRTKFCQLLLKYNIPWILVREELSNGYHRPRFTIPADHDNLPLLDIEEPDWRDFIMND